MSRRATNGSWRKASETITPAIIQGRWAELCIPRNTIFSDNCRHLALAFPKARARPRTLPAVRLFDAVERHSSIRNEIVQEIVTLADLRDSPIDPVCLELSEKIARARDVPPEQVRPLFDYVAYRRFRCERRDRFVLADCSVSSLLKRTEEWHAALRAANYRRVAGLQCFPFAYDQRWPSCFEFADFEGTCEQGAYTLTELRSAKELFEEGQHMHHCVATYTRLASTGGASIWSLRLEHEGRQVGRVTIRVALPSREIVEARRFANQKIHPYELEILRRWAAKSDFTVCHGI